MRVDLSIVRATAKLRAEVACVFSETDQRDCAQFAACNGSPIVLEARVGNTLLTAGIGGCKDGCSTVAPPCVPVSTGGDERQATRRAAEHDMSAPWRASTH